MTTDATGSPAPELNSAATPLPQEAISPDDRTWGMLGHVVALAGNAVGVGQYVGPLVIYLLYKDKSKFVAFHALQSLFFQLGVLVAGLAVLVLALLTCGVLGLLGIPLAIVAIVYPIIAAIRANNGEWYEYWLVGELARRQVGV